MNDEPCMCGTQAVCWADNHVMGIDQAAVVLGMKPSSVLVAVHRGKLTSDDKDPLGRHVFSLDALEEYKATRRARHVAQREHSM